MGIEEVIEENLLTGILFCLLDGRIVQSSFLIPQLCIQRIELTYDSWANRALSVKGWLSWRSSFIRNHDMCIIVIAVLDTIDER